MNEWPCCSVVVLVESLCPRRSSMTNLQVLVLVFVLGPQILENCQGLRILQTVRYVWSREVHKFGYRLPCMSIRWRMSYLLMSDITYWYMSVSKPFFTVAQCCCPRGKSLSLSSNLKSLTTSLPSSNLVVMLYQRKRIKNLKLKGRDEGHEVPGKCI